jgi:glycosyltransferase involved in cell wall biosynthesis
VTKLAFVIPTWNRPDRVGRAVASIATQMNDGDGVVIHVVHDGDIPETTAALAAVRDRWPHVIVTKNEHSDYSAVFRAMFRAQPDADWVWTFGDDDVLRDGALEFMLPRLQSETADFIHIAELQRASGGNSIYQADSLLKLCCKFGWIEMTGFITANITRGALLAEAADTPNWPQYAKTAFVQSCILLEKLRERPATFMDIPLVATQDKEQNVATQETWRQQNIPGRYLYVVDAIEMMFDRGILTNKLPRAFFRYLSYHLWDRHLTSFIGDYLHQNFLWRYESWGRLGKFPQFLEDEKYAAELAADIDAGRDLAMFSAYTAVNLQHMRDSLEALHKRRHEAVFPYSYVAPPEPSITA